MENRLFLKPDCNKFTLEYMSWKWIIQLLSKEHENMIDTIHYMSEIVFIPLLLLRHHQNHLQSQYHVRKLCSLHLLHGLLAIG